MSIIGICGFAGSGKGTVADYLSNLHYKKLSFADGVKDATASIFGWPRELLEGDTQESREFREKPDTFWSEKFGEEFTPRKALQIMGTESGRKAFHNDIWIFQLEKKMKQFPRVVIADVRFPNEVKFIRDMGGYVIRVKRGPEPDWYDLAWKENVEDDSEAAYKLLQLDIHVSETAWIGTPFDFVLENDGNLSQLKANIDYMLKIFKIADNINDI